MHAVLFAVAVALAGQLTDSSGTRYSKEAATGEASNARIQATTPEQSRQLWADEAQPRGAVPPQSSTLRQPPVGQSDSVLPADGAGNYRSQGQFQPNDQIRSQAATGQENPSSQSAAADTRIKPSQLIRNLLEPPTSSQFTGTPLSLAEAVQGASSRNSQTTRVEAYWDLSAALADYYLALRETTDHQALLQSVTRQSPQWEQARQALDARVAISRHAVLTAQARLQRLMGGSGGSGLPLPSDVPHCGAYDTRFEEIFGNRPASLEAQQLHELLPLRHQDLRNQADAVAAAYQWLQTVSQRRDPNTDGSGLLKAHELLILRRRAFVYTLRSYNAGIARYAELASPGDVGAGRLVAMLIHTDANQSTASSGQDIRRASAEESVGNSSPPRTFAEGQSQRAAAPPENGERSILRRPTAK